MRGEITNEDFMPTFSLTGLNRCNINHPASLGTSEGTSEGISALFLWLLGSGSLNKHPGKGHFRKHLLPLNTSFQLNVNHRKFRMQKTCISSDSGLCLP